MKQLLLISILITIAANNAFAVIGDREELKKLQVAADNRYAADKWHSNHYFTLGAGLSGYNAISSGYRNRSLTGGHFNTAIGHWAFDAVGLEFAANVSFTYFPDMQITNYSEQPDGSFIKEKIENFSSLLWDSSFIWGIMVRFPISYRSDNINIFLKLYQGYGTSVYWLYNADEDMVNEDATRYYSQGYIFGWAIGNIFNAFNKKTTWFIQLSFFVRMHEEVIALKDGGVLPETLSRMENTSNLHLLQFHLTVGFRLY